MQISHNNIFYNYRLFFFKAILFYIFTSIPALSEEVKIGSITEIIGEVIAITEDGDERVLDVFDEIFLKDEILIGESSSATLQFNDNTTIVMKELTSLNVNEFENSTAKKNFQAKVGKGKIIIESGAIAKNSNGEMLIDLSNMSLGIRGTRFNASIKPNGNSEVGLAEDSFGNVGQIEISSEGQTTNLTSTDQVIEVTKTNEVAQRDQSEEEKQEFKSVNETLVKVSKIDEAELTQQLEQKLAKGNLQDANNDGVVDEADIESVKETIKEEKKQNIDFIVENSSDENTTFLSDVIDQSDDQNIGETIEKIIETKDTLVEGVVGNLSDKDNEFITTSNSEGADLIKEKIFETIVAKETDNSAEVLSKVMAKSDEATINSVINNITEKNSNEESKLSLKVMADFSEKSPEKLQTLSETNKDQIDKLAVAAVEKASTSNEDANLIAKVVSGANDELANKVIEEVSKTAVEEKQSLSVKVLKAIVDTEPEKIKIINEEIKEDLIQKAIEATKDQKEGNLIEEEDLTDAVTEIIVKTDTTTAVKVIEEINKIDTETNLSLEVISRISEKDSEKLNELSDNNKAQMDELTIDAVQKAENTSDDSQLIAQVVSVVNNDLVNVMIEEVSRVSIDEKQTLSAKVLQKIVETEPDKMEIINEEVKDVMIKQTVESAKNQKEGTGAQDDENFTDIISEIIVNTNTETASKMIDEINKIDTETNLSLEVISGISEKDSEKLNELSDNNKAQMDELTIDAVQKAENTSDDSQLIANVIAVVNDDLVNKVVEEVSKTSTDDKKDLSAKVLKAIVDTEPNKIETLDKEIKDKVIEQVIESAKDQQENLTEGQSLSKEEDYTDVIADIVSKTDNDTARKVFETLNEVADTSDSKISLSFVENLSKKDNYEEKLEILSATSNVIEKSIDKTIENAVEEVSGEDDLEKVKKLVENSKGIMSDKIINTANKNEESKEKITKVVLNIIEENPNKAVEIIERNKNTNVASETIKTKIENNEAITTEDFDQVFDTNISPN